jgi:hypothetical protein
MEIDGKMSSDGLPERGASLKTSLGLASTEVLFYDLINNSRLGISDGKEEYIAFMKSLGRLFYDAASAEKGGLKEIHNRRDEKFCAKEGSIAITDTEVAGRIRGIAAELFRRQWEHARACDQILHELFEIQKDPSGAYRIKLHPSLLEKGITRVNEINKEARRLLAQYYVSCEAKYVEGMQVVAQHAVVKPALKTGGASRNKTRKRRHLSSM